MSNLVVPRRSLMLGGAAVALMPAMSFAATPDLGKPAPLFTAVDSNGKTWSLADLKGKVVVIETTNHDCPYVRKHYTAKNMQTQQREAAAKGVVWLTSASSATGEEGYVTAQQANELTKRRDAAPARRFQSDQLSFGRSVILQHLDRHGNDVGLSPCRRYPHRTGLKLHRLSEHIADDRNHAAVAIQYWCA
jgi:hypothetical protein